MAYEAITRNSAAVKAPHGFTHPVLRMVPGDCVFAVTTLYTRKLRQRGVKQLAKITQPGSEREVPTWSFSASRVQLMCHISCKAFPDLPGWSWSTLTHPQPCWSWPPPPCFLL